MKFELAARCVFVPAMILACAVATFGQVPNRPVITEVFTDPPGDNDGPVGRLGGNAHQEYIEIYLPPSASLSATLNKDALRLTFYEVEGDSTSSGLGLVNYRFDLPTFDLDPSNGITPGAIPRPSTGVVVLGWVDYASTAPVVLAGTSATRVAMINGGITSTGGTYTFIAMNGAQDGGTTNFPVPTAENKIDMPAEAGSGVIQNGSAAYLLVNRDSPSYVMLCDDAHTAECPAGSDPQLANDAVGLNTPASLDGLACNDHGKFLVTDQPYDAPTGDDIDLETVLPLGGAFSLLVPQVPEVDTSATFAGVANGYARRFVDVAKTTETAADDDPVADATTAYRHVRNDGPFFPSPGRAALTTTPPELGVAGSIEQSVQVLADTTGRPGILAANVGGNYPVNLSTAAGASSNSLVATFAAGSSATGVPGQTLGFPTVAVTVAPGATHGAVADATVTVTANNANGGDPPVAAPIQNTTLTATVLKPTAGLTASGLPFQTTVFAAIQGIPASAGLTNEFRATSLGAAVAANLGGAILDTLTNGAVLADSTTNIGNGVLMQTIIRDFPDPAFYIELPGPPGEPSLVQAVLQSAEVQSGASTYDNSFDVGLTVLRAIRFNLPDTFTFGGFFTPTETLQFVDATGRAGRVRSGLSNATTTRTFELAILDTNVKDDNSLETGATDDVGIVVEVETVEAGSPVAPGEFVFLSYTGGLQGADIDGVDVPPGNNIATILFLDLDNLHTVLGIRTLEAIILVDGSGTGELDVAEIFSLNASSQQPSVVAATPNNGASLWRTSLNTVRLSFSQDITTPAAGQVEIRQLLPGGLFGPDLSGGFGMLVQEGVGGSPRVLRIRDTGGGDLVHRNWYAIRNAGTWAGVADFELHYLVQIGDVDGDMEVLDADVDVTNLAIPSLTPSGDDRRNVDGDGAILNADASSTNARIPSLFVPKPSGH
ncbi:MAG: hypothetical protein HOP29_06100 [Phycisphaerales bacterium]|nr:hypothetical protein [Phycisphaerales bacterium]